MARTTSGVPGENFTSDFAEGKQTLRLLGAMGLDTYSELQRLRWKVPAQTNTLRFRQETTLFGRQGSLLYIRNSHPNSLELRCPTSSS